MRIAEPAGLPAVGGVRLVVPVNARACCADAAAGGDGEVAGNDVFGRGEVVERAAQGEDAEGAVVLDGDVAGEGVGFGGVEYPVGFEDVGLAVGVDVAAEGFG